MAKLELSFIVDRRTLGGTTVETETTETTGDETTATGIGTEENHTVMTDESLQEGTQTENVTGDTVQARRTFAYDHGDKYTPAGSEEPNPGKCLKCLPKTARKAKLWMLQTMKTLHDGHDGSHWFGTTKGKHVEGNQEGAANVKKMRTWHVEVSTGQAGLISLKSASYHSHYRPLDKIK
ncbi:hypothetical protein BC629DRAFT_1588100 [Irpex lacteus]|nr:hypothetical protein BC629DRAFT_1588100 [Irpex lacteus]